MMLQRGQCGIPKYKIPSQIYLFPTSLAHSIRTKHLLLTLRHVLSNAFMYLLAKLYPLFREE